MTRFLCLVLFLLLASQLQLLVLVSADFGDTVSDPSDANPVCPVITTCPVICVENLAACPTPDCDPPAILCPDGHCRETCTGRHDQQNPCKHACANVACPKVDAVLETCEVEYKDFYAAAERCAQESKPAFDTGGLRPAVASFLLLWIVAVTICWLVYCQINRRFASTDNHKKMEQNQYQAGYRQTLVGTILHGWVVATIWAFQLVLLGLSVVYYANQQTTTARQSTWYEDEESILLDFEIVWVVGFVWSFLMKWPPSLKAVFWQRSSLSDATVVAVWTPKAPQTQVKSNSSGVSAVRSCIQLCQGSFHKVMTFLFGLDSAANGTWTYCQVQSEAGRNKYFVHNFRRYNLDTNQDQYLPSEWKVDLGSVDPKSGLPQSDVLVRKHHCGRNVIPMDPPTLTQVLVKEFTQPYYTYQNFIMWSWVPLWYYYMAIVQSSVIITGGVMVALFQLRNEESLHKLTHVEGTVQVLRDGQYQTISPIDLVPGDVIMVEPGIMHCDAVLVSSAGVLVDESALTGEANPIAKTAMEDPSQGLDTLAAKRHVIQAGCTVLEAEHGHNQAVVTHTGSYTAKGELLRNIFSYQRHPFKFDVEVGVVILILVIYGFIGFSIVFYNLSGISAVYGWFYGIYAVSSVMPPLLPTVFTVSVGVSDHRLANQRIACTNSEEILVAGKVRRAFFDKTGTLTKQGLEFISARCGKSWATKDAEGTAHISAEMALCIATCHSLTRSQQTGDFIGNPVDQTMFAAIGADILQPSDNNNVVLVNESSGNQAEIVRHFDFDHHRMTQSVIVKSRGKLYAFVKGSGESMIQICSNDLPTDFNATLRESARAGVYQITMAYKELEAGLTPNQIQEMSRGDIERDLGFLGVINFKNVLREETPGVIEQLEKGDVRCVIVTGDSVLTGIRIAKESGIISAGSQVLCSTQLDSDGRYPVWLDEDDNPAAMPLNLTASNVELAISGSVWENLCNSDPQAADEWAEHIRVYGRCTPVNKVDVVARFVDRGFITLMCGDGGNDCGALKTAHVGIALSDAEASIVAPFTSLDKTITSVLDVLKEGRCTLASALASYKFMILYGQLVFATDISNSIFKIMLPEWCWVFMDGIWAIGLGFTLPLSKPAQELAPSRPTSSLLGLQTMCSTLGVLFIHYVYYIIALLVLFSRDWFDCRQWKGDDISNVLWIGDNYETETMFLVIGYQFISSAMTYNFGYEWRASWLSNQHFVLFVAAVSFIHFYVMLYPGYLSCLFRVNCDNDHVLRSVAQWELVAIQNDWNTTIMPNGYRFSLLLIVIANTLSVMAWDYFVVNGTRQRHVRKKQMEHTALVGSKSLKEENAALV